MRVFEVCLTNYCNFKCDYCISDKSRGNDKFSEPIKLDELGNLLLHDKELRPEEVEKRKIMLDEHGQEYLDAYVQNEHQKWVESRHLKHDYTDWLDFDSLIDFVRLRLSGDWLINLTGGEPLYYPNVERLIRELTKTHKVLITTNASLISKFECLADIESDKLFFRIGYHPEFRNLETFVRIINFVKAMGFKYTVNYVLHPRHYVGESTSYAEYIAVLEDNEIDYEITPFEGEFEGVKYPNPPYQRSEVERYLFTPLDKYNQATSPMGTSFLMAEPNGNIYECQGKSKLLGNVYAKDIRLSRIEHVKCFGFEGCYTARSANTYLDKFMGEKIGINRNK